MRWRGEKASVLQPQCLYEFIGFEDEETAQQVRELIEKRGRSLYLGRTDNLPARVREHTKSGPEFPGKWGWIRETNLILVSHLPAGSTVGHADAAETRMIHRRRPAYNWEKNERFFQRKAFNAALARYYADFGTGDRPPRTPLSTVIDGWVTRLKAKIVPPLLGACAVSLLAVTLVLNGTITVNH